MFGTLICVYENSITVNVVKPLVPKPFLNTKELYDNNYTFVVQELNFYTVRNWLSDKYNRRNHLKVIEVENFFFLSEWLEMYFLNHHNDVKYAIVGYLNFNFHYQAVKFVKEKNDTCYQMFPTEKAFSPKPSYFHFTSALASSLHTGVSRLRAAGFLRAFKASRDFRDNLLAIAGARPLAAKYENELTFEDLQNNRLKQNLIVLENLKSVLYAGLITFLFASAALVAEVCKVYCTKPNVRRNVIGLLEILFYLKNATKRNLNSV